MSVIATPRRSIAATIALPVLFLLAACGSDDTSATATTTARSTTATSTTATTLTTTSTTAPTTASSASGGSTGQADRLMTTLRIMGVTTIPEATAVKEARAICASIDATGGLTSSFSRMVSTYSVSEGGALMGAAVAGYCPEHDPLMYEFMAALAG